MYNYVNQKLPDIFNNYFQKNNDVHDKETRQADLFHAPFGRLDVRKFSIRIHGSEVWNSLPCYIKCPMSIGVFKQKIRKHLIDKHIHITVTQFW